MSNRKLYFSNMGYFDLRAMLTFGVSAKPGENPIGHFGTGFKYATSIILRLGGKMVVETTTDDGKAERLEFTRATEVIRGQSFEAVKVNGNDAGFTTRLGINWEPWMAFRELYSNMLDECGAVSTEKPGNAQTCIMVECEEIFTAYQNRDDYFLTGEPLHCDDSLGVELHKGPGRLMYFRGIAVANVPGNAPSFYKYNRTRGVDLSEERTARYASWQLMEPFADAVMKCEKPEIVEVISTQGTAEEKFYYQASTTPSAAFIAKADVMLKTGLLHNDTVKHALQEHTERQLEYAPYELSAVEQTAMQRAIWFLKKMDMPVDEFEIKPVRGMGKGVMGRALEGKIYITELAFSMGVKQIASTLLEEWVHLSKGYADFDRDMQNWLFDKILTIGENITGEPL